MSKICIKCKTKNLDTSEFCKECGYKLPAGVYLGNKKNTKDNEILKFWESLTSEVKNTYKRDKKKWDNQSSFTKVIICVVGIILILGLAYGMNSENNLTEIGITGVIADSAVESHIDIDNTTTELVIHGDPEVNATITAYSNDLNITKQNIQLDANNSFDYKINIPATMSQANVKFEGSKAGKDDSFQVVTIKRPTRTPQPEQKTQPKATGKYDIGGSKFDVPDKWKADDQSDSTQIYFRYLSLGLNVEKLADQTSFDSSYKDAVKSTPDYVTTTQNDTIEGIPVKIVVSEDKRNTDNFKDYYFTKNGNFYHIGVEDYSTWKSISTQYFDDAVTMIIKTING